MMESFEREDYLRERLNRFLHQGLGLAQEDYYARLDFEKLLELKSVVSDINNILTMKTTLSFVTDLCKAFQLSQQESAIIRRDIMRTKPNANGFDVDIRTPIQAIAEVKCTIPVNRGKVFGAAQRKGIIKDITALVNGKKKSTVSPRAYYKFMVFLDLPQVRQAVVHLQSSTALAEINLQTLQDLRGATATDTVYVVFAGF